MESTTPEVERNADIALVVPLRIKAQMARDGIAPNQLQKWWSPDTERDVDPMNDPEVQAAIRHLLSDIWHAHDGTARARCRCGHPKSEHGGPCRGRYCNCEQFEDSGAMTIKAKCALCGPFESDAEDFQATVDEHMASDTHQQTARLRLDLDAQVEPEQSDGPVIGNDDA